MNEAIWERLSKRARRGFQWSEQYAKQINRGIMSPEHLLMGAAKVGGIGGYALRDLKLNTGNIAKGVARARLGGDRAMDEALSYAGVGISVDQAKQAQGWLLRGGRKPEKYDEDTVRALEAAVAIADARGSKRVRTEHIVLGVLEEPTDVLVKAFRRFGTKPKKLRAETEKIMSEGKDGYKARKIREAEKAKKEETQKKPGRVQQAMQRL